MYDVIIIGCGPAGMSSAIYAGRRKMNTVVFEASVIGGQMANAVTIENYPGFKSISGLELAKCMEEHVKSIGIPIKRENVREIRPGNPHIVTTDKADYKAKTIIIATGAAYKRLGVKNEVKFSGKGVSYCTTCDAPLYRDKVVAVVGGGNSAVSGAMLLERFASKVYLIHRRDELRADEILQDGIKESEVKILWDSVLEEITGKDFVSGIKVKNVKTGEIKDIPVSGVFIEAGITPATDLAKSIGIALDGAFIRTNPQQETNIPGIYAAGDITGRVLQVCKAVGEGCVALLSAYNHIKTQK